MSFLKKVTFIVLAAVLVVAWAAGCASSQSGTGTTAGSSGDSPKVAPDFTTTTLTGDTASFAGNLRGKPVVLNFAASWCGPCELEAPVLVNAYNKYKDKVQFFGLAVRDTVEDQTAFAERHGLEFPIGMDPDGKIVYQYQRAGRVSLSGIPTTFFIDKDGNIVDYFIGPLSEKTFELKIQTILPQ